MKTAIIFLFWVLPLLDVGDPADTSRTEAQAETGREVPTVVIRQKVVAKKQAKAKSKQQKKAKNKGSSRKQKPRTGDSGDLGSAILALLFAAVSIGYIILLRSNIAFSIIFLINLGVHLLAGLLVLLGVITRKKPKDPQKTTAKEKLQGCGNIVAGGLFGVFLLLSLGLTTLFLYFESTVAFGIVAGFTALIGILALIVYLFDL